MDRPCLHCGSSLPAGLPETAAFCCTGCESVWTFLRGEGLFRYYDLRGPDGVPAIAAGAANAEKADHKWLEPIATSLAEKTSLAHVELDVQGVHCSACVWLMGELFRREAGGVGIVVNPAVGRVDLTVEPTFDLPAFVATIERLGYRFGPPVKARAASSSDLVWRMGVCVAIAMNTMIFGFAIYCGLTDGPIYRLFETLNFGLSFVSVLVGGSVFFRSAWRALRQRVLHLDLPIALGVLLAFTTSTQAYLAHRHGVFFDTLNVFIALMLVGRFLQERVVARNRADILSSSGAEHVYTRRIAESGIELVACKDIVAGDRLMIARADLVPVDAKLESEGDASFSLDWISGESRPKAFASGKTIPAGAFSCNEGAVVVKAETPFETSSLSALLRTTRSAAKDVARATPFWTVLSKVYVACVLVLAAGAFGGWMLVTHDLSRSLGVVTALLIVTCPCAFGIATPLAYELAQAGLRRSGLFVRSAGFLDRAAAVRRVVFDKTGTLTTGTLRVENPDVLVGLAPSEIAALREMTARSAHPKSQAIARILKGVSPLDAHARVVEAPGHGVELVSGRHTYRLGAPSWAAETFVTVALAAGDGAVADHRGGTDHGADVVFTVDGRIRAGFVTAEELRPDAAAEVKALAALGAEPWILSGDAQARAEVVGAACGIPCARVRGGATPEAKAAFVRALDRSDVLFVGDGINDALVAEAATCSGTPAIDRPFMAARSDFYVVTPGLRPVRLALVVARRLATVVKRNLAIATAYNVVTVSLAIGGEMTPLLCAVLMPLASVTTVLATTFALQRRSDTWKS
jgi:Cu2+-exporting ATPase